jgi:hypothetical protein
MPHMQTFASSNGGTTQSFKVHMLLLPSGRVWTPPTGNDPGSWRIEERTGQNAEK